MHFTLDIVAKLKLFLPAAAGEGVNLTPSQLFDDANFQIASLERCGLAGFHQNCLF